MEPLGELENTEVGEIPVAETLVTPIKYRSRSLNKGERFMLSVLRVGVTGNCSRVFVVEKTECVVL